MVEKKNDALVQKKSTPQGTRRSFVKGGITAVPVILTLSSRSAFAQSSGNASTAGSEPPAPVVPGQFRR